MTKQTKNSHRADSAPRTTGETMTMEIRKFKCVDCGNEAEDQCESCLAHICHEHTNYGKYEDAFVCKGEDKCEERCGALLESRKACLTCNAERRDHNEVKMGHAFRERISDAAL